MTLRNSSAVRSVPNDLQSLWTRLAKPSVGLLLVAGSLSLGCQRWSSDSVAEQWPSPLKYFASDSAPVAAESASPNEQSRSTIIPKAREIRFDGQQIVLGDSEGVAISPPDLVAELRASISGGQWTTAQRLTLHHSDTARQALFQSSVSESSDLAIRLVASALDRVQGGSDWNRLLQDRAARAWVHESFESLYRQVLSSMQNGDMSSAMSGELPVLAERTGQGVLVAEAWRLVGIAHLISGAPEQAISAWQQALNNPALDLAMRADLTSLQAIAWKRMDREAEAVASWHDSMRVALELTRRDSQWTDHRFWKRAVEFGESRADWPVDIAQELRVICARELGPAFAQPRPTLSSVQSEAIVWSYVGVLSMRCDLPQAALVAFKRGELGLTGQEQGWLRLAQAHALTQVGQAQAAVMLLGTLANEADPTLKQAAQATLGSVRASNGSIEQGLALLERSLTELAAEQWSGQAAYRADLGLAYLMVGRSQQGLEQLHLAQHQFQTSGDWVALVQSLENEAKFHEATEHPELAQAARQRILAIEQRFAIQ